MRLSIFVFTLSAAVLASAAPVIDDTPTRVQSPLKVNMRLVGTLRPKAVEVSVSAPPLASPIWVDVLSGNAYRIDAARIRAEDGRTVYSVPGYDSPTFVTDRSVLTLDESWEARWLREQEEA